MAFFLPTKTFTFARDGRQPEIFEPGVDEAGEPLIFEFQEHQAVRLQQRGVGVIVSRSANYMPTDPAMKEVFDRHMAEIGAHVEQAPVISPGPAVRMSGVTVQPPAVEITPPPAEEQTETESEQPEPDAEAAAESEPGIVPEGAPAAPAPAGRRRKRS
jgi:hypothetical protein